jgi:hypothetical protein
MTLEKDGQYDEIVVITTRRATTAMCSSNDVSVINADGTQSHNTTCDKVPNRVVDWLLGQKFIKEGVDWPVLLHSIDPVIAEKVRRIESYGIGFELDFMEQFKYWSSRLFGGR